VSDVLLERIAVALERIANNGAVGNSTSGVSSSQQQQDLTGIGTGSSATAPQAATTMLGASGVSATGQGAVTHEMLMNLVQPLVQSEPSKSAVKSILNSMGLNRLGEAREDQYASLYQQLSQIGGQQQAQPSQDLI
jgi:hypothetical protein